MHGMSNELSRSFAFCGGLSSRNSNRQSDAASNAAVYILQTHYIILSEICTRLHLDQRQRNTSWIFQPMHTTQREVNVLILAHDQNLSVAGDSGGTVHDDPMLCSVEMTL